MSTTRKAGYLILMAALTSTALSACYWQAQRYRQARHRWDVIRQELSQDAPQNL